MANTIVSYRIHEPAVHGFHMPGGAVYDLIAENAVKAKEGARARVGKRSLKLMKSIGAGRPRQDGGYAISAVVYANAKHALWHHEGTPRIYPKHGRYLTVPRRGWIGSVSGGTLRKEWLAEGKNRGEKPYFLATSISGQTGNPYLRLGLEAAIASDSRLTSTRVLA